LLLALDEIANLTPLPSLPSLMAEGGGSGITSRWTGYPGSECAAMIVC